MPKISNPWFSATLILIITTVIGLGTTLHFYQSYTNADQLYENSLKTINDLTVTLQEISNNLTTTAQKLQEVSFTPKILIKYNNGTKEWHNQTFIPIGWSLFNATQKITNGNIEYQQYSFGKFITSINGVKGDLTIFWALYIWNVNSTSWTSSLVGAEAYRLKSEDIVAWYLSDGSSPP
jgi:hypothetical protein